MRWTIRHKYEDVVRHQVKLNRAAAAERIGRREAWAHIANLAEAHFKIAEGVAKAEGWIDNLYVNRDDETRVVQMHMGRHLVGTAPDKSSLAESGATVVMSQNSLGSVVILLYPYESAVQQRTLPYLVWKITDHPMTIKAATFTKLVADFMTYARLSSALFAPLKRDRDRIAKLERRSLILQEKLPRLHLGRIAKWFLVGGTIGLLAIFGIWLWEASQGKTPRTAYEPLAGLVALSTGWLTALLREQTDAWRKAQIQEEAQRAIANRVPKAQSEAHT